MKNKILNIAVIGASGYTGMELIRILLNHPNAKIKSLIADSNAGKEIKELYPHFSHIDLPKLKKISEVNFSEIDLVFSCLPHASGQEIIKSLFEKYQNLKVIDLSADFRLKNIQDYEDWYKTPHMAADLQKKAVYGLSEINRVEIKKSNLIACPGCYPTSILLPLLPLIKFNLITQNDIIIDSKSAISGAGRSLKIDNLYCERNNNAKIYGVGTHRHIVEIEQEINQIIDQNVKISFTPHLIPINRGIISTIYVKSEKFKKEDLINCIKTNYRDEYFIDIVDHFPSTAEVAGTNLAKIAVFNSRIENQFIIACVIDNLIKGASGQAVQNMNIIYDFDERAGLNNFANFI